MKPRLMQKQNLSFPKSQDKKNPSHTRKEPMLESIFDAQYVHQKIAKINPKQLNQLKLMIRPRLQLVDNIQALYILLTGDTRTKLSWQSAQQFLQKHDIIAMMSKFQSIVIKNLQLKLVQDLMAGVRAEDIQPQRSQWNYDMECLQLCLLEATQAIVQYFQTRVDTQHDEEVEQPQNLNITMEHLQTLPHQTSVSDFKTTPRTILKNTTHSKSSSQSTVRERPQTSAGFHTPEKDVPNYRKSYKILQTNEKTSRSVRSTSSNSQSSSKKYFLDGGKAQTKVVHKVNQSATSLKMNTSNNNKTQQDQKTPIVKARPITSTTKLGKIMNLNTTNKSAPVKKLFNQVK